MENLPDMIALQDLHFRPLPVWINSNAYLNGARHWNREKDKFIDQTNKIMIELIEENGSYQFFQKRIRSDTSGVQEKSFFH